MRAVNLGRWCPQAESLGARGRGFKSHRPHHIMGLTDRLRPHSLHFEPFYLGIKKGENRVRYSDPEKTVLDFIYIWRYNDIPEEKIAADVSMWAKNVAKEKMMAYAKKYPKTVAEIAARVAE
jgi:hypothetical protein